jgi:hypothetical protein
MQRLLGRRRVATVQGQRQRIVQHLRNYAFKHWRRKLQTWVRVNFNQVAFKRFIHHDIKTEYFKVVNFPFGVNKVVSSVHHISRNLSDLRMDGVKESDLFALLF